MVDRLSVLSSSVLWMLVGGAVLTANAQPKQPLPALVGATEIMKVTTASGFVDDVVAYDNQRLAYVVADTSTKAELHVVQLGCATCIEAKQEVVVDLAPVTLRPTSLRLVGQRAFVIGATEDGNQVAALIELAPKPATDMTKPALDTTKPATETTKPATETTKPATKPATETTKPAAETTKPATRATKAVYKLGPATHVTLITRDGKTVIALHKATATKVGTRHEVEVFALETGKRLAKGKTFDLDKDHEKKLDFRINHWSDGWTRAGGLKGGEWSKKENQRSPDTEATYDLIAGKFLENKPIGDLFEQRKRYQTLADAGGQLDFMRMKADNTAIELWRQGKLGAITLDQPLAQYDTKSLQGIISADGSAWIVIKVDPVNAEAVARKKADPEYLDVFKAGSDGKATRKARILAKGVKHRFGVVDNFFWLLERSTGFDRGGRVLTIFQLTN